MKKIGALWLKTAKSGQKYYSGNIEIADKKIPIVIFKNTQKENEKQPDYNIILSEPKQQGTVNQAIASKNSPDSQIPFDDLSDAF
jgi:uncharacterized protein (DUF736 family)